MKKVTIVLSFVLALVVLSMWVPEAEAYERYNDGCQTCHGAFDGGTSTKGSVFPSDDKHTMHRNSSYMNTECGLCHSEGDNRDPYIGFSDGTGINPGLGCTGCHTKFGLRAHHVNAGFTSCAVCHPDDSVPPPENTMPVYYGTADTNVDMPCNPDPQANINENWTIGDSEGIDNDGDGLYDVNDPDCAVAVVCGDGTKDAGEQCDDGNTTNGDGCQADCQLPVCGDNIVDAGEQCDDGNTTNGDGCQADCQLPVCGDNIVDTGEQCDDGNSDNGDGCENCTLTPLENCGVYGRDRRSCNADPRCNYSGKEKSCNEIPEAQFNCEALGGRYNKKKESCTIR